MLLFSLNGTVDICVSVGMVENGMEWNGMRYERPWGEANICMTRIFFNWVIYVFLDGCKQNATGRRKDGKKEKGGGREHSFFVADI